MSVYNNKLHKKWSKNYSKIQILYSYLFFLKVCFISINQWYRTDMHDLRVIPDANEEIFVWSRPGMLRSSVDPNRFVECGQAGWLDWPSWMTGLAKVDDWIGQAGWLDWLSWMTEIGQAGWLEAGWLDWPSWMTGFAKLSQVQIYANIVAQFANHPGVCTAQWPYTVE